MKRIIILALVAILAVSAVFAGQHIVTASASPYAKQYVKSSWDTNYDSHYGWGGKVGYRYFTGPVLLGVDVVYEGYNYSEYHKNLANWQFLAKVGAKAILLENMDLNADFGCGVEIDVTNVINTHFVMAGNVGLTYFVTPMVGITLGTDLSITWPQTKNSTYQARVFNVFPTVGVELDF